MLLSQPKLHNISNAINTGLKKKGSNNNHASPAILYHYPCPDGAFAALAAHLYFKATSLFSPLFFPNTVYNPLRFFLIQYLLFVPFILLSIIVMPCVLLLCRFIYVYVFLSLIEIFSAEDLPLNEISDLYLLDFVGPDGFIQEISTKVPR